MGVVKAGALLQPGGFRDWRALIASPVDGGPPWDWLPGVLTTFDTTVRARRPDYPCYFGTRGQVDGNNWFTVVDERAPGGFDVAALARSLSTYRDRAWTGPKRQSLIVFVGPPEPTAGLDGHTARFWRLLTEISRRDPAPWPSDVPTEPSAPDWQWCFAGEPWFAFMCSPGYQARRSRNVGPCLTLVFQTRRVFDGLSGASHAGQAAKARVREAVLAYDAVPPHPHMGGADGSSVHKWRQYALPDDQRDLPGQCPWSR